MIDGREEPPVRDEEDGEYCQYLERLSNYETDVHPIMLMVGKKGVVG